MNHRLDVFAEEGDDDAFVRELRAVLRAKQIARVERRGEVVGEIRADIDTGGWVYFTRDGEGWRRSGEGGVDAVVSWASGLDGDAVRTVQGAPALSAH